MKDHVLLIGNDINNATGDYSWKNLLEGLVSYAKLPNKPSEINKPFPLLYEEIYLISARLNGIREIGLKRYIASNTRKLQPNEIHQRLMSLPIDNLFTTNYDLTLEKCQLANTKNLTNKGLIKEQKYGLFRHHHVEDKKIWHLHGSETSPGSITLGFEHYGGLLQQMRNYVATGIKGVYKKQDFDPLIKRLKEDQMEYYSWVDYFFTHDVHILGLNLDFVEMHLWWLLTYRARAIMNNRVSITNSIYYYYPSKFKKDSKHKLDLFYVNGVEPIAFPIYKNNRVAYYNRIIDHIESTL